MPIQSVYEQNAPIGMGQMMPDRAAPLLKSLGSSLLYVRFTMSELEQVEAYLLTHTPFTQVNLQYDNPPLELGSKPFQYQIGVKILEPGRNYNNEIVPPKLDLSQGILLKQIDFQHSIPIACIHHHPNTILQNSDGIFASLRDKYASIMHLTKQEIIEKSYYMRTFIPLGEI
jgi:hypothetical protein